MGTEIEKRFFDIGTEEEDDGTVKKIRGYAAVFNQDSADMGFIEQIAPGAFAEALQSSDVRVLFNHDSNIIIGRMGVNLDLREDGTGLYMELSPIDDPDYRRVEGKIRSGLITQQSFGFTVEADEWSDLDTDHPKRKITKIKKLFDVSPVTYPAYPGTSVALRKLDELKAERGQQQQSIEGRLLDRMEEDRKRENYLRMRGLMK